MRSTIHLVTAEDCLALRPVLQPVLERYFNNSVHARSLAGIDRGELAAAGCELLAEPATLTRIGAMLSKRFRRPAEDLAHALRMLVPLVQIPPRGVWGRGGMPVLAAAESWLGRPLSRSATIDDVVLRYLAAFGPASVADIRAWSGLTGVREVVERLRPRLREFRDEGGAELFDLPEAPRPREDLPAPVRFLPEFDNLLLSHADRTRMTGTAPSRRAQRSMGGPMFLVDGFASGTWRIQREKVASTLLVSPFGRLSRSAREEVEDEGRRLLAFMAPSAPTRAIRFKR